MREERQVRVCGGRMWKELGEEEDQREGEEMKEC